MLGMTVHAQVFAPDTACNADCMMRDLSHAVLQRRHHTVATARSLSTAVNILVGPACCCVIVHCVADLNVLQSINP